MNDTITIKFVKDQDGNIDQAATETAFIQSLSSLITEQKVEQENIARATNEIFDTYRGDAIRMKALASAVLTKLNAPLENYQVLSERVLDYVRSNADGKGSSIFQVKKGAGGGVVRVSDQPVK